MEQQYSGHLSESGLQDWQEDGYSKEFLQFNCIELELTQFAQSLRGGSNPEPQGSEYPGSSLENEVKIPEIQIDPEIWNPPVWRQTKTVSSSTESEQKQPQKGQLPKIRVRTVFSEEQKRSLMQRFRTQRYLSPQERRELANTLGLNCKQVKTWYQNRRMKLKRSQNIQPPTTSWNQSHFSPISSQTLSLTQELTPTLMKPGFISCQQQTMFSSGPGMPFRQCTTPMEHQTVEVLQSSPICGNPQHPSTSSCFQNFPPANCSGPDFGDFHKEHFVIPAALNSRNPVPRSGMVFPTVKTHQSPSFRQEVQYIAASASFPLSACAQISPSFNTETFERDVLVSSQDIQIQPNNWSPVQSDGSSPNYATFAPIFDGYEGQQSGAVNLFSESYPVTLSGAL